MTTYDWTLEPNLPPAHVRDAKGTLHRHVHLVDTVTGYLQKNIMRADGGVLTDIRGNPVTVTLRVPAPVTVKFLDVEKLRRMSLLGDMEDDEE